MPVLRLLTENASALGSPGTRDEFEAPAFNVAPGNVEKITLDYTGWLGSGETLSASAWVSDVTLTGATMGTTTVSALATIPDEPQIINLTTWPKAYEVTHTATASGGRKRVVKFWLYI